MEHEGKKNGELKSKIYNDFQSEIWKYYDKNGIKHKDKELPEDTVNDFFSYLFRLIPQTKRNVHYSKEIENKIKLKKISKEHCEILKNFEKAFSDGKDMNIFLSNKIKNSRETDFLRYTWHLFHLHMSNKFVNDYTQMKNNRSDTQLLCLVEKNNVYFVDVIPHPTVPEEYFNLHTLEILIENDWINKIGFYEFPEIIPGSFHPQIKEAKDIFEIYSKYSLNIGFELRGKVYLPLDSMNSIRRPSDSVRKLQEINKEISKLSIEEGVYKGFQMIIIDGEFHGTVELETPKGDKKVFFIF